MFVDDEDDDSYPNSESPAPTPAKLPRLDPSALKNEDIVTRFDALEQRLRFVEARHFKHNGGGAQSTSTAAAQPTTSASANAGNGAASVSRTLIPGEGVEALINGERVPLKSTPTDAIKRQIALNRVSMLAKPLVGSSAQIFSYKIHNCRWSMAATFSTSSKISICAASCKSVPTLLASKF